MSRDIIDAVLLNFKAFLESSFTHIEDIFPYMDPIYGSDVHQEEFTDIWLQANWEVLVEFILCPQIDIEALQAYGNCAELYDNSDRISRPNQVATHKITIHSKNDTPIIELFSKKMIDIANLDRDLDLDSFCYCNDGYYYPFQAPLNSVLSYIKGDLVAFSLEDVTFRKTPINTT
ncbi:hypothetical protein [Cardinium endosymbiont of Culicoides punctatus]|uniref:hypothetical protein n=1 Tax=Cardinium endosymbiont of Culicoides punctatus TaxID=2304601 RepID=UPI00105917A8|nr:hypothetical protein [Cardinium endosymbiont of Culicoides punctatus]TDG94346.1 hypothetical protein CCPUN_08290 [Cardinium endosymbiont of Culicoides punctatus]